MSEEDDQTIRIPCGVTQYVAYTILSPASTIIAGNDGCMTFFLDDGSEAHVDVKASKEVSVPHGAKKLLLSLPSPT